MDFSKNNGHKPPPTGNTILKNHRFPLTIYFKGVIYTYRDSIKANLLKNRGAKLWVLVRETGQIAKPPKVCSSFKEKIRHGKIYKNTL
jgi:hypothetical protein